MYQEILRWRGKSTRPLSRATVAPKRRRMTIARICVRRKIVALKAETFVARSEVRATLKSNSKIICSKGVLDAKTMI